MIRATSQQGELSMTGKFLGLLLFALLFVIGLLLVLPVIPGLLFLVLALFVLSRISPRVAFLANRNSWMRRAFRRLGHIRTLPARDLLRLSFWVAARAAVSGAAAVGRGIGSLLTRPARRFSR